MNFDENEEPEANHLAMMKAPKSRTGQNTFAARDSKVNDQKIKQGEILGMENGKITVYTDMVTPRTKVTRHLIRNPSATLVTIYYGEGIKEESAEEVAGMLRAKSGSDLDITVINGGQPVYYFIISVE